MTEKQRQAMMAMPNYREFIESGDATKAAKLISMAYLVQSIANAYNEDAIELIQKHDLVHKKLKTRIYNLSGAFDLYDKEVSTLIDTEEAKLHLCNDYDYFRAMCDKFLDLNHEQKGENNE